MGFLLANWKLIAIVGMLALGPVGYFMGFRAGDASAVARIELEMRREAQRRTIDTEKNDAEFRNLPEREQCLALARSSGMPESACSR